jgi:hypothetical protein
MSNQNRSAGLSGPEHREQRPGSRKALVGAPEVRHQERPREVRRREPTGYPGSFRVRTPEPSRVTGGGFGRSRPWDLGHPNPASDELPPLQPAPFPAYTPNWNVFSFESRQER